jgi:hypothetical protein
MKRNIITIENGKVSIPSNTEIWMTQHELADLFQCFIAKINANVRSILKSRMLDENKVCRTYLYKNGNSVEQYNLEMIIALSFRVRSYNADTFRGFIVRKTTSNTSTVQICICSNRNNIQLN